MYQTVIKNTYGNLSISYHKHKMTPAERKTLKKYKVFVVTQRKLK